MLPSEFEERMHNYTRYDAQSFYDAMIFNMDSLRKYMLELILHQQRTPQLLKQKKLMQTQEDHSHPIPALNVDSLKVDLVVIQNTCSEKEDSHSETASQVVKEQLEFCNKRFLSKEDLKGTRIEHGFKRAFMSFFGQDANTFTSTMLLNVDQLQKQLDKDYFQEDGSMDAFWVINRQFQKFIDSRFSLDYDSQMIDKYFVEYTRIEYDKRVNKRHMQTQESKIDTGKTVDADLVVTKSSGTESEVQDDSSRSRNDTDVDDIFTGHRFSPNKTSAVYEKTSPRSNLRWKPTGRIFKSVGLRWIPTGKLFDSCTSKVDSEPPHGSNSSLFTTSDASNNVQQQPDSTSSTSTLATTVTANGNFDL
ncbi:hypothetical protein Tco_0261406 [Tanacetum coccineum]